jgi:LPS-assembly protein
LRGLFLKFLALIFTANVLQAEITLNSRNISYDPSSGIIAALGDVVVKQTTEDGVRELHCEKVSYNKKTEEIKLIGEAIIKEPNGDVISVKNVELDSEFKNAIAKALVIILKDSSKIKAREGIKNNEVFTFENATYSPCREVNCKLPLWDLAADKFVFDRKEKKFIYKNVRLRLKGLPIFFTPYFSHPSPDVKRKTGFLTPVFRHYSDKGFFLGLPFYIALSRDKDLKLTPFLNTKGKRLASGKYRQKFTKGDFKISASVLAKSKSKIKSKRKSKKKINQFDRHTRWHVDSYFSSYNFDKKRLIVRLNRSSDVTYKTVYPIDLTRHSSFLLREKYNDSKVVFDVYDKNYFLTTESHLYQTADKKTVPTVLPHINFNCIKNDFTFDSDTLYLTRKKEKTTMFAKDFFRSTNKISWDKSIELSPVLLELNSGFRADFYNVNEAKGADRSKDKIFPILENQVGVSVPFTSQIKSTNQTAIWGPKITLTSVETSKKRAYFKQNEDSVFDNCSDLNLYAINRFGGYDAIENGEKISAGFENSIYNSKRRWLNAFVGRAVNVNSRRKTRFKKRDSTVGRLILKPLENVSFRMRFVGMPLFEKTNLFESGINAKYGNVFGSVGYYYDKRIAYVQKSGVSQIGLKCGARLTEFWSVSALEILNLKRKAGKRSLVRGVTANYKDECFEMGIGVFRTNFKSGDIKLKTSIALTIVFKNLGSLAKSRGYGYNSDIGNVA